MLALTIKQLPFENHVLSVSAGELKSIELTALNPRQRVPVIKDGDFVLTESVAAYLDQKQRPRAARNSSFEDRDMPAALLR